MAWEFVSLTRAELFEQVWAAPVAEVAKRHRVSGSWLRRVCLKHDIPVPPRGHWARVAAGERIRPPRLPHPARAQELVRVRTGGGRWAREGALDRSRVESAEAVRLGKAHEALPQNRVAVLPGSPPRTEWAREANAGLRRARENYLGLREARVAGGALLVSVSEGARARAVAIVDALAGALQARGLAPPVGSGRQGPHWLVVEGVPLGLRVTEKVDRVERPQRGGPERFRLDERYGGRYDYRPTGQLSLRVFAASDAPPGAERVFRETTGPRLEERLNEVLLALTRVAVKTRVKRERLEEERRQRALEWRRLEEERARREAEAARARALWELAERWARAQRLRAFIAAVERSGHVPGPPGAPTDLGAWLEWARALAAALDPLPSPIDS